MQACVSASIYDFCNKMFLY